MNAQDEQIEREIPMAAESSMVAMLNKSEIDQQIATAKTYPRSIRRFSDEAKAMVTLNESIAQQCVYALPRAGKTIEGASARFGEIMASAWGNCRAGARVVNEGKDFITAQGVFHDLERNVAITYEVQRRITDAQGRRFKADMIGVTANAACSIALRNAILKGIPKAFWEPLYVAARKVIAGDIKTLANKRASAIQQFAIFGVTEPMILAKLGRQGIEDVTVDDLVTLFGLLTAIQDGDTTPEQAFATDGEKPVAPAKKAPEKAALPDCTDADFETIKAEWEPIVRGGKKTAAEALKAIRTKFTLTENQALTVDSWMQEGN